MSQFLEQRDLFDGTIQLKAEEKLDPMVVIERFFGDYRLHECRHHLWTMVEACLTTDNDAFSEAAERGNLLLYYHNLERLMEAAVLLVKKRAQGVAGAGSLAGLSEKVVSRKSKTA